MNISETVGTALDKLQWSGESLLVAVSGGVDSVVLLHLLATLQSEFGYQLAVATFDHQLRGKDSEQDILLVQTLAQQLDLPCYCGAADVRAYAHSAGLNLEAAARQARYTFLLQTAIDLDSRYIALAHHRDDQIETTLMHILRGAGLAGLRGMLPVSPLTDSHLRVDVDEALMDAAEDIELIRPMLHISRADIEAYADAHQVMYQHDPTNVDTAFLRNRLRHEIIPVLEGINPNLKESMSRLTTIIQGDYEIIQQAVSQTVMRIVEWGETVPSPNNDDDEGGEVAYVDRREFLRLSDGLKRQVLRYIVFDLAPDLHDLSYENVEDALDLIERGYVGQQHTLPAELILTIGYDEVTLHYGGNLPFPRHIPHLQHQQVVPLDIEDESRVDDNFRFYSYWVLDAHSQDLARTDPLEATLAIPPDAVLNLRTRRAGDRFSPYGMAGKRQKLSDTFTNLKVPRAMRDRVPLLTVNDEIAWFVAPTIHGLRGRISQQFAVTDDSDSVLRVRWEILP